MHTSAVITADVVRSTQLPAEGQRELKRQLSHALSLHKTEFFRGDSFQAYIKDSAAAYELVLQIRCIARSLSPVHDVRSSIGIGRVGKPVRSLAAATGEAFVLSGRAFDEIETGESFTIRSPNEQANATFRLIARYTDHLFSGITAKQARVILELLKGKTQTEVARHLKKTQAAVSKNARSGGWSALEKLIFEYRNAIRQYNLL